VGTKLAIMEEGIMPSSLSTMEDAQLSARGMRRKYPKLYGLKKRPKSWCN